MWILNNTYFHFLCATLLAFAVYMLGLSGGFYFDDEWNILRNQALQVDSFDLVSLWHALQSGTAGPLGRPLAMLSFAVNYYFFGFDPFYFKLVNLVIHLLCGWVMYFLVLALCEFLPRLPDSRRKIFAFLVMLLWLLHPLNLTTVLYPVQRMASLSALFCLLSMFTYLKARQCNSERWVARSCWYFIGFMAFWPLALASKENAILLPVYLFLLELIFLRFKRPGEKTASLPLVFVYLATLILPVVAAIIYFSIFPDWILNSYSKRDFTLYERVLTESRVLMIYIGQSFVPVNSILGIFHDDIQLSQGMFSPLTTLASILAIAVSLVWSLARFVIYPAVAFGILFFFAAHSLESSIIGLELVHEHRNYLAIFSILFSIAYCLVVGTEKTLRMRVLVSVLLILFLGVTTITRAATWGNPVFHAINEVENHPRSPRANYGMGKQYAAYASSLVDSPQKVDALNDAARYFEQSARLRESYTDGLFGLLMIEGLEGREMSSETYKELLRRLSKEPFSNNNYNYLNSVFSCLENGDCQLPRTKLTSIIQACLDNKGFSGRYRSQILARYQSYIR